MHAPGRAAQREDTGRAVGGHSPGPGQGRGALGPAAAAAVATAQGRGAEAGGRGARWELRRILEKYL